MTAAPLYVKTVRHIPTMVNHCFEIVKETFYPFYEHGTKVKYFEDFNDEAKRDTIESFLKIDQQKQA